MAKAKARATKPAAKKTSPRIGLLKSASKRIGKAAARVAKAAVSKLAKSEPKKELKGKELKGKEAKAKDEKALPKPAVKPGKEAAKAQKPGRGKGKDAVMAPTPSAPPKPKLDPFFQAPVPDKPNPRATKLPAVVQPLTKREMEGILTAGGGRGTEGEGSLKGRLLVKDGFPYLQVVGRDKRELIFLLEGPDQEVLPAYLEHKVSVSGRIKKTTNYGGIVYVRKYSAKKPEEVVKPEAGAPPAPEEQKLRYLSPGDVEQICSAGMGAGMKGFATMRGTLEMTADDFFLVVSNGGTRQQVSFNLEGKSAKGLRKLVGQIVQVNGVVEKSSGWGGRIETENVEPRPNEFKSVSREAMQVASVEGTKDTAAVEVLVNNGLSVRLQERAGYIWAIEPTTAKRMGLREANFELPKDGGGATREFFFTPRNPGVFDVEFFLAKALAPAQVAKTFKLNVNVKVPATTP